LLWGWHKSSKDMWVVWIQLRRLQDLVEGGEDQEDQDQGVRRWGREAVRRGSMSHTL